MSSLDKHLGSNEKVIRRFRPSRKSFLKEYLSLAIVVLIAIGFRISVVLTALSYMFFALSLVLFIKVEYKIWSRAYALTSERVMKSEGILSEKFQSCVYSNITDLELKQSFFEKVMNTGTVSIDTSGSNTMKIFLEKISNPFEVKKGISDMQSMLAQRSRQSMMQTMNNNLNQPYNNPNQPQYNPNQPRHNPNQIHHNPNQHNPNQPYNNPNQPQYNPNQQRHNIRR